MNFKQKVIIGIVSVAGLFSLAGCSILPAAAPAALKVDSESYVISSDKKPSDGNAYLALKVNVKNKTKSSFREVYSNDFSLYDKKGNKISNEDIYSYDADDQGFKSFQLSSLPANKSVAAYVVFEVTKGEKYELHYSPEIATTGSSKQPKDVVVKVDTSHVKDLSSSLKQMAKDYVNAVFWGEKGVKSKLKTNLVSAHDNFNTLFGKSFSDQLEINDYYTPSSGELNNVVDEFEAANAKRGKVDYTIKEMFPNYAVINVKPTVINMDDVDAEGILDTWEDQNEDKYDDYDAAMRDAAKYLLQNISKKFDSTSTSTPDDMDSDGEQLVLKKDNSGKWSVDNSDSDDNYEYTSLVSSFMGGLSDY